MSLGLTSIASCYLQFSLLTYMMFRKIFAALDIGNIFQILPNVPGIRNVGRVYFKFREVGFVWNFRLVLFLAVLAKII
jgi:hypothetical protein